MNDYPENLKLALKLMKEGIRAERYLVCWCGQDEKLQVISAKGMDAKAVFVSEALSVSLLQQVAATGEPCWSDQEQVDGSLTFMLAGIKSYICAPVKFPGRSEMAILYVDDRKTIGHFSYTDYTNLLNIGRKLANPSPTSGPLKAPPQAAPKVAELRAKDVVKLPIAEQVSFFRSMATFIHSGIPLLHGLHALSQSGESPRLKRFCDVLHRYLLKGNPLSEGCHRHSNFSPMVLHMLKSAESSGQLAEVLQQLSIYLEENYARQSRIRSALVYPALVLCVSLVMAVVLPTFVLRDQLKSYTSMTELPLPTKILVAVGDVARFPGTWAAVVVLLLLLPRLIRMLLRNGRIQRFYHHLFLRFGPTSRAYCAWQEVSLASSLGLQLKAGVHLLQALSTSLAVSGSPLLAMASPAILDKVRQGVTLTRSLAQAPGISHPFRQLLMAGEESGHIVSSLEWIARSAKLEFEHAIDTSIRLIEPVAMLLMGVIVGIVTLGTLLPSLKMMESM